jgi:hypothetical protein
MEWNTRRQPRNFPRAGWFYVWAILLVGGGARGAFAETTYWRVTVDRVTVISDGTPQRCSRLATQLLAFESILRGLADWSADFVPPPVALYSLSQQDAPRVLLSESDRRKERGNNMRIFSKYLPGADFNITAIVDEGSDEPLQSVLLLYAQGLLTRGPTQRRPPWFQLGVANLLNGLLIRTDGSVLLNRNLTFVPTGETSSPNSIHYDLAKLLGVSAADLSNGVGYREFMSRARDWAEFGLLTTPERRTHYQELSLLMQQGESADDAVKDTFGVPLEQLVGEFEAGKWHKEVQYRLAAPAGLPAIPTPTKLAAAEANTLLEVVAARAGRDSPERM